LFKSNHGFERAHPFSRIKRQITLDDLVKSLKMPFSVIPAEAGIQYFQMLINTLDSGFHRSDDFLREHHS